MNENFSELLAQETTELQQLYESRLQDIIQTIKNAANQTDEYTPVEQAEEIKSALINERESQIQRLLQENAGAKTEFQALKQKAIEIEKMLKDRESKYYRLKDLYKEEKQTVESARNQLQKQEELKEKITNLKAEKKDIQQQLLEMENSSPEKLLELEREQELFNNEIKYEYETKLQKQKLSYEKKIAIVSNENEILKEQNEEFQALHNGNVESTFNTEIQSLNEQMQQQKQELINKDEVIEKERYEINKLREKKDKKSTNIAMLALQYQSMSNEVKSIKDEVLQLRQHASQPFLLANEEISALLAEVYKYLNYSELKNTISQNVFEFLQQREQSIKKDWNDAILDVETCADELK